MPVAMGVALDERRREDPRVSQRSEHVNENRDELEGLGPRLGL